MEMLITVAVIIAFILPTLIILIRRLWPVQTFRYFALYWLLAALINCIAFIPGLNSRDREIVTIIYNLIDIPLMLLLLYLASRSFRCRKFTLVAGSILVIVEMVGILTSGLYYDSIKYSLGIGLFLVLLVAVWNFRLYFRKIRYSPYQKAMMLLYAAIIFEYGSFAVVYVFDYFGPIGLDNDNFLIYYISSLVTICIASTGLLLPLPLPTDSTGPLRRKRLIQK